MPGGTDERGNSMSRFTLAYAVLLMVALCTAAGPVAADWCEWVLPRGTPGDWLDDASWSGSVPQDGDHAEIDNGGTAQLTHPAEAAAAHLDVGWGFMQHSGGNLTLGGTLTVAANEGDGSYALSDSGQGASLTAAVEVVGGYDFGLFTHSGGTNTTGMLTLGSRPFDKHGQYLLSGDGELIVTQTLTLNRSGWLEWGPGGSLTCGEIAINSGGLINMARNFAPMALISGEIFGGLPMAPSHDWSLGITGGATATQTSGVARVGTLHVGHWSGGEGAYVLEGGTLASHDLLIAEAGPTTGLFRQTGGLNQTLRMRIGQSSTRNGRYELEGGALNVVEDLWMNSGGISGGLVQNSGTCTVGGDLYVHATTIARYSLNGGHLETGRTILAYYSQGELIQTGGSHVSEMIVVAWDGAATGTCTLTGGTVDFGTELTLGYEGGALGKIVQTGGAVSGSHTYLGRQAGARGDYELGGDGELRVDWSQIAHRGDGNFTQTGGVHAVANGLYIGKWDTAVGRYILTDGEVSAGGGLWLGGGSGTAGNGCFDQSGGTVSAGYVNIARDPTAVGTYTLSGGSLETPSMAIGVSGVGRFVQSGGVVTVTSAIIGRNPGSAGVCELRGGRFDVRSLSVAKDGNGTLALSAAADLHVTETLSFGAGGVLTAEPGSVIHMTGGELANASALPGNLAGLANVRLAFDASGAGTATFEAAGEDMGTSPAGWAGNFAVGALELSGGIHLAAAADNRPASGGAEAVYVDELILNTGGSVDLNGLKLYYLNGGDAKLLIPGDALMDGDVGITDLAVLANHYSLGGPGGVVGPGGMAWSHGDFTGDGVVNIFDLAILANYYACTTPPPPGGGAGPVPEPASAAILALGALALYRRRRPGRRA